MHGRPHAAPAVDDPRHPGLPGIDIGLFVDPAVVDVQYHRGEIGQLQAVVDAVGLFIVLEGDAVARLGGETRPDRADARHAQAAGDVHVALEVLEALTVAHQADHVGVVFELLQAVFHDLGAVRAEHAELPRVQRQSHITTTRQLAQAAKAVGQQALQLLGAVEVGELRVAVEGQQIAAQAQHAQVFRPVGDMLDESQLGIQVVGDHVQQLGLGHGTLDATQPAQGGGAGVEGPLDLLQFLERQTALGMTVHAGEADSIHGALGTVTIRISPRAAVWVRAG